MDYISLAETTKTNPTEPAAVWSNRLDTAVHTAGAIGGLVVAFVAVIALLPAEGAFAAVAAASALALAISAAVINVISAVESATSDTGEPSSASLEADAMLEALGDPVSEAAKAFEKWASGDSRWSEAAQAANDLRKALKDFSEAKTKTAKAAARLVVVAAANALKKATQNLPATGPPREDGKREPITFGPAREPTRQEDLGHNHMDA
jgi:hypothetical protein